MRYAGLVALLALLIVLGCGGGSGSGGDSGTTSGSSYTLAQTRVARLGYAVLMYGNDSDDVLPLGASWMDGITPYIPAQYQTDAFRSPAVPAPGYGFALNSAAAGRSFFALSENTVTVFDSTLLTRNASASLDTAPSPPRYPEGNVQSTVSQTDPYPIPPSTGIDISVARLKQSSLAMQLYSSDSDDVLPPSGVWMDVLTPYTKNQTVFRSPIFDGTSEWGYAFNNLNPGRGITSFDEPATTVNLFDSTVTIRNAEAPATARPTPGRYNGLNAVGFLDGHVTPRNP